MAYHEQEGHHRPEQLILGAVLTIPGVAQKVLDRGLSGIHFRDERNAIVFESIRRMVTAGAKVDAISAGHEVCLMKLQAEHEIVRYIIDISLLECTADEALRQCSVLLSKG